MAATALPFLMFQGEKAEEAIEAIERRGPEGPGAEGSVRLARFRVAGQSVKCIDSPVRHPFDFTPSFSFFVECGSEAELDGLIAGLGEGGRC